MTTDQESQAVREWMQEAMAYYEYERKNIGDLYGRPAMDALEKVLEKQGRQYRNMHGMPRLRAADQINDIYTTLHEHGCVGETRDA